MPSQKNLDQLKNIQQKLSQSTSVVMADYRGLSVGQQDELRREVKQVDGELIVVKNTLLKLALEQEKIDLPSDFEESLQGPTITLFAYGDEIAPLKVLANFAKINEMPTFKVGFLNRQLLDSQKLERLAQLPNKTELISITIATIKAPLSGFVNVLSGNLKNLLHALEAIRQQKNKK